ncbi:MAG: Cof-type HAD-IIB family hydrolase [Streptococcaceae bacterium]|jgi:Cof subfamily protein (haloacid dehalogenase superfamily)|nr:Cof-type HAD-IIB family hydrolase [Streptococcaceae bacterium]
MIKLIGIDLDGTLLNDDKLISPRNQAAIKSAKAKGVKIVITTGRPLKAIEAILKTLDLYDDDFSVTFNGGLVQMNRTGETLVKQALSFAQVKELSSLADKLDLLLDLISDGTVYQLVGKKTSWYQRANPSLTFKSVQFENLDENLVYNKAISAFEEIFLNQQMVKIPTALNSRFEIFKSRDILLEFMPKGVNKANGLAQLGKHLGIKQSEVMTIGDEANDLSMIEWAGLGIAMGNAVPIVKAASDFQTLDNNQDGVALAIEQYVL